MRGNVLPHLVWVCSQPSRRQTLHAAASWLPRATELPKTDTFLRPYGDTLKPSTFTPKTIGVCAYLYV